MSKLILPKAKQDARESATPVAGEILYDKDTRKLYYGDGATPGGIPLNAADDPDSYVYGIVYDTSIANAAKACKRVVWKNGEGLEVAEFSRMPAHNFKRCVMSDLANRKIEYYLNPSDSSKRENGQSADLTGADGDVMVEIPVTWYRIDHTTDPVTGHELVYYLVSNKPFIGSTIHPYFYTGPGGSEARTQYVGAFRSVLCHADGSAKEQYSADVPAEYTAGDRFRSIAGHRPSANVTRANFRAGAVANGGTLVNVLFMQYIGLMMSIDACSFDSQSLISGYCQLLSTKYASLRKTGRSVIHGNGIGDIMADETTGGADADLLTMYNGGSIWNTAAASHIIQSTYRGIEDPFGCLWYYIDGVNKYQNAVDYTESGFWYTNDTNLYVQCDGNMGAGDLSGSFPAAGYTGSSYVWIPHAFPKTAGFIGRFSDYFFACSVDGDSNTYLCDRYDGNNNAGPRAIFVGGGTTGGATTGIFDFNGGEGPMVVGTHIGSRISA